MSVLTDEDCMALVEDAPREPALTLPTKQMLCDLRLLQALRRTTILGAGPPVLRVTTVSSRGWSPAWQETQFPGLKLIDLPKFFQKYRRQVADPRCTLRQLVAETDELCLQHRAIMEQEFEEQIERHGADGPADALLDDHAKAMQRAMFAKLLEVQGGDYDKYFEGALAEFHLKVAGFLAELTHMARVMLDADGGSLPMLEVEGRWIAAIAERNRRGALGHTV